MLEIQKLRKDINWLLEQIKCLMKKSDLDCPIEATEWSPNHSVATGNPYILDSFVWLNGHIYKSLIDNNIYPPTNASYWDDLGEGHLLLEEQSNWNAITGRAFIRNKPTNTSDFVNDGEDGSSPYATLNDLSASIPLAQDLDSVLTEGDTAQNKQANIESIGLYDSFAVPFGFARIFASKSRIIFQSKLGTIMGHISQGALGLIQGTYAFTINLSTLTNNRIATFQNKSGVVAYLSDISASAGINATAWSANHTAATGNPYLIGTRVYYAGNVYQAIATNDSIIPTNATYWDDLGPGFLLEQEPTPALQEVVNKGGGISNYGGVGNASIQSTNFVSNRTVYFNNDSLYPLAIVDNLNAAHNISFDIDSLIRNNVSYSWASILAPQVNADWNATSGFAQILNKPTIPSIAGLATTTYVDTQDLLKVDKVAGSRLITSAEGTIINNQSGTNTGDNATNSQYSGLAASKQDTLTPANTHTFVDTLTSMTTPVDADRMIIVDNSVSLAKKITWANIKATLKTYFDTFYTTTSAVASQITAITNPIQTQVNTKISGVHTLRKPAVGTATSNALTSTAMATIANVNDRILVAPYIPAISFTAANMYVNVTTLIASAACKIVIYSDVAGVPTTKLYESTDLALTSNGVKPTSTGFTFAAGTTYWIGVHTSLTASISAIPVANALCIGTSGIINYTGYSATATYASGPPTTFGTSVALSSLLVPFVGITL